jgi:hypothetical protein
MPKTMDELMREFRQDVDRWRAEIKELKAEGQTKMAERVEEWVAGTQRILERWGK